MREITFISNEMAEHLIFPLAIKSDNNVIFNINGANSYTLEAPPAYHKTYGG